MELIYHRRNTLSLLSETPRYCGVEIDVRTYGSRLIIHHEPFEVGVPLSEWLDLYAHGTLILNVKEEGLEAALLEETTKRGISNFFFLDQSFPFLVKTSSHGERRSAVRVSEFEGLTSARALAGVVDWVWVDCFTRFPLTEDEFLELKSHRYNICVVSPELQGRESTDEVSELRSWLADRQLEIEAVCTKRLDLWA